MQIRLHFSTLAALEELPQPGMSEADDHNGERKQTRQSVNCCFTPLRALSALSGRTEHDFDSYRDTVEHLRDAGVAVERNLGRMCRAAVENGMASPAGTAHILRPEFRLILPAA